MMLVCGKSFSQTDTKNKVVIDTSIAKKIAIDLIKGDECKEELKITKNNVLLLEKKVSLKDSIIIGNKKHINNLDKIVEGKDNLLKISEENLSTAKKQISKYKGNLFLWKTITLVTIGLSGFLILK
jgi:hypothetical protein